MIAALALAAVTGGAAVGWLWKSKKDKAWDLASVQAPWQGTTSIHGHISKHVSPGVVGLTEGGERLPDEKDDAVVRWAAGAMDGAMGHHFMGASESSRVKMLHRALRVVLEDATPAKLEKLYEQLLQDGVLEIIDPLLERIVAKQDLDPERLEELALWIAKNAPDREPVKFAIAILGVLPDGDHTELLMTLGRHEELTLYAAVALSNTAGPDAESKLFELARHVDGWGRIHIVERLATTGDPEIQAWMLREGYQNSVMHEYLAYTCAVAGGLRRELMKEEVDPALLAGAGDIIMALIAGGPAKDMSNYEDGAVVVKRYLHHLGAAPRELQPLIVLARIQRYLADESDWSAREKHGWTPALREELGTTVAGLVALPHWKELVNAGLASEDPALFDTADQAAAALGVDTWEHHFARVESGEGHTWYTLMQTDDEARIDRVVALAEKLLPLAEIATGPAEELGLGLEWANHSHLDFVLQDLRRFAGKGWPLIRAGLRSPVVRNRHMALRALSPWGQDRWPPDARGVLEAALEEEPSDYVRAGIETLLAGQEIEDPQLDVGDP